MYVIYIYILMYMCIYVYIYIFIYIYIYICIIYVIIYICYYLWRYDVGKTKCKIDFYIITKCYRLAARERVFNLHPIIILAILLTPESAWRNFIHPLHNDKEKKSIAFGFC